MSQIDNQDTGLNYQILTSKRPGLSRVSYPGRQAASEGGRLVDQLNEPDQLDHSIYSVRPQFFHLVADVEVKDRLIYQVHHRPDR
jgi:hypothetical protein